MRRKKERSRASVEIYFLEVHVKASPSPIVFWRDWRTPLNPPNPPPKVTGVVGAWRTWFGGQLHGI